MYVNIDTLQVISKGPGIGVFLVYALQGSTLYTGIGKENETKSNKKLYYILIIILQH